MVRAANASEALLPIVTASLAALNDDDDDAAEDALRATWPAEAEVAVDYHSDAAERAREALAAAQADVSRLEGEVAKLGGPGAGAEEVGRAERRHAHASRLRRRLP